MKMFYDCLCECLISEDELKNEFTEIKAMQDAHDSFASLESVDAYIAMSLREGIIAELVKNEQLPFADLLRRYFSERDADPAEAMRFLASQELSELYQSLALELSSARAFMVSRGRQDEWERLEAGFDSMSPEEWELLSVALAEFLGALWR